jgi:superfamily II DNA or RNA helicase
MVVDSLVHKQQLCLAATGSGKSLVIYCIVSFFHLHKKKGIILVPSVSLTTQIFEDFKDYGCSDEVLNDIRLIGGDNNTKEFDKQITITTWQSAMKITEGLDTLDFVLVDEAHGLKFENKSTDIVYNAINATYRIGLTGTLPDDPIAKMSILACVGAPKRYIRTQGLIERGLATPVHINVLKLRYSNEDQALFKYVGNYTKKLKFIKEHENRNMFISKMSHAVSKIGNTVIMCSHTEHMKDIFKELMKQKFPDVEVENKNITGAKAFEFQNRYGIYYIAGATKVKDRVKIIDILKGHDSAILVSNYQLFSTGINAKGIKNIMFASPMKSYTTITQSIGRAIRLHVSKNTAEIYDFVDDFSVRGNSGPFYNQYKERLAKSYNTEGFPITERTIIL